MPNTKLADDQSQATILQGSYAGYTANVIRETDACGLLAVHGPDGPIIALEPDWYRVDRKRK